MKCFKQQNVFSSNTITLFLSLVCFYTLPAFAQAFNASMPKLEIKERAYAISCSYYSGNYSDIDINLEDWFSDEVESIQIHYANRVEQIDPNQNSSKIYKDWQDPKFLDLKENQVPKDQKKNHAQIEIFRWGRGGDGSKVDAFQFRIIARSKDGSSKVYPNSQKENEFSFWNVELKPAPHPCVDSGKKNYPKFSEKEFELKKIKT